MSVLRHTIRVCVVCGGEVRQPTSGRRRLYCGPACRQRAYRLRQAARARRNGPGGPADPRAVADLLSLVLRSSTRR